jgi:hypothetical protein
LASLTRPPPRTPPFSLSRSASPIDSPCQVPTDPSCTLSNAAWARVGWSPTDELPPPRVVYTAAGDET